MSKQVTIKVLASSMVSDNAVFNKDDVVQWDEDDAKRLEKAGYAKIIREQQK